MATALEALHSDGRIVLTFPEEGLPQAEQASFIAFIKAEWTARQSRLTQQDADSLSDEVDASWWARNRQRVLAQIEAK